jgi:peptidoglycan/xylan/chitin deacetylase (PgdA/CDA1 family)
VLAGGEYRVFAAAARPPCVRVRAGIQDDAPRCCVCPQDARVPWRRYIVRDVLARVRPGAIVILHEVGAWGTGVVEVLEEVLSNLNRRGYEIVTVSELLKRSAEQEWSTHHEHRGQRSRNTRDPDRRTARWPEV